jgi:hypothetical protein
MPINKLIQSKLIEEVLDRVSVNIANQWTAEAGMLNDDLNRPGKPLRRKCRNNEIHGAVKEKGRWFIYRVGSVANNRNAEKLEFAIPAENQIDFIESLGEYEPYFEGIYTRNLLYHLLYSDPPSLVVKTRIAGEHISRLIALQRCSDYDDEMKLYDVINLLSKEGLISDLTKGIMNSLRIYGNITLHNPNDILGHEKSMARIVCSSLHQYLENLKEDGLLQDLGESQD